MVDLRIFRTFSCLSLICEKSFNVRVDFSGSPKSVEVIFSTVLQFGESKIFNIFELIETLFRLGIKFLK